MQRFRFSLLLSAGLFILLLSSCARPPHNIDDACAMLAEKRSFFSSWAEALRRAEKRYNISAAIILATIHVESSFDAYARPPWRKLFGFIAWKRLSSAYGYSQALDGTWAQYQKLTGRKNASRTDFADSVDFIAWFHDRSARQNNIRRNDTYHLYLNYYFGHQGFHSQRHKANPAIKNAARRAAAIAVRYHQQLRFCPLAP